jgi:uncharacterized membrane protein
MEGLYLLILLVASAPFVAVIALLQASSARRSVTALQARVDRALAELRPLQAGAAAQTAPPEPSAEQAPRTTEPPTAEPPAVERAAPEIAAQAPTGPEPAVEEPAVEEPVQAPAADEPAAPELAAAAQAPPGAPEHPPAPAAPAPSLEEQLGTRWAVRIGGIALALGAVLLVRHSIEQGFFGPKARVTLAALLSLALIAAGEWLRRSERASPIEAVPAAHIPGILTAAGTVGAFGTAYAAHAFYDFLGPAQAFAILGFVALATMLAAALHGPALAGLGLAGALVVPLLIASQQPNPWPVVIYLVVVASAAYALARLRRWLLLAAATVAGAVLWGFAILASVGAGPPDLWEAALLAHTGLQLVLAAAFMAIAPHLTTADPDAEPDWVASLALAALAALAIRALAATPTHEHWTLFAAVVPAILALTAWLSAPAAAAAVLAGIVALAALCLWPATAAVAEPDPGLAALATEGVARLRVLLRAPGNVQGFLAFAALASSGIGVLAAARVWRGRTLPLATCSLSILAAVATPLMGLTLAWLRVTQFDRSYPFALAAVGLAGVLYLVAHGFGRIAGPERTPTTTLALGAFASATAAALALALVMALDRGYLTVAFALTAFATALVAAAGRIPLLRYVVVALGLVVLGRLAWDPRIMGADMGTAPVLNWLLFGYGVPALAFLGAARVLEREAEDLAARLSDALGVLLAALLFFFQIRHALNGGDPFAPTSGHIEQGLLALTSLGFAAVLVRVDRSRANTVFRAASLLFGVASAAVIMFGLGLGENPLFENDPVLGPVVASSLVLAYLLPALAALALARVARGARPEWYVDGATALGLALLFGYVALELRHAFHGASLSLLRGTTAPELGLLALASFLFAAALIRVDIAGTNRALLAAMPVFMLLAAAVILLGLGAGENPLLTGDPISGPAVLNALLPAYLLPALAALFLARMARDARPLPYAGGATALALLLLFGWVALELRHAFHGESLSLQLGTSAAELGLLALAGLLFAAVLIRVDRGGADPALRAAAPVFMAVAAVIALLGLGVAENPLLENDPVNGPALFNTLLPGYAVPALGAYLLARIARGVRPAGYVTGAAALALVLIFAWVTLEVRHAFQGESLLIGRSTGAPEVWAYSVAWLALGIAFLVYGLWRGSLEARAASALLVVLSVLKVFLYDLTGIEGAWRAFSMIALGLVLIGIGLVYQKLVFARTHAPPPA